MCMGSLHIHRVGAHWAHGGCRRRREEAGGAVHPVVSPRHLGAYNPAQFTERVIGHPARRAAPRGSIPPAFANGRVPRDRVRRDRTGNDSGVAGGSRTRVRSPPRPPSIESAGTRPRDSRWGRGRARRRPASVPPGRARSPGRGKTDGAARTWAAAGNVSTAFRLPTATATGSAATRQARGDSGASPIGRSETS